MAQLCISIGVDIRRGQAERGRYLASAGALSRWFLQCVVLRRYGKCSLERPCL